MWGGKSKSIHLRDFLALKSYQITIVQLSPKRQMSECRSNTICAAVEWPDHHCGDDDSGVFLLAVGMNKLWYSLPVKFCHRVLICTALIWYFRIQCMPIAYLIKRCGIVCCSIDYKHASFSAIWGEAKEVGAVKFFFAISSATSWSIFHINFLLSCC